MQLKTRYLTVTCAWSPQISLSILLTAPFIGGGYLCLKRKGLVTQRFIAVQVTNPSTGDTSWLYRVKRS